MRSKKGISPLIATVLVIGFTIVLAALVIQWGGGLFKDIQDRTGETAEGNEKCATQLLNLEIGQVKKEAGSNTVTLIIDNLNQIDVSKFDFRLYLGNDEVKTLDETKVTPQGILAEGERKKYTLELEAADYTALTELGVFPNVATGEAGEDFRCTKEEGPYKVSS